MGDTVTFFSALVDLLAGRVDLEGYVGFILSAEVGPLASWAILAAAGTIAALEVARAVRA